MVIEHADTHTIHLTKLRNDKEPVTKCGLVVRNHIWVARPSEAWMSGPEHRCGNCERAF